MRKYRDRKIVDPRLPAAYKRSPSNERNCGNCIFYKSAGARCQFWKGAKVRPAFICAKWVDKSEKILRYAPNEKADQETVFATRQKGGHYRIGERKRKDFKKISERRQKNVKLSRERRAQYLPQGTTPQAPPSPSVQRGTTSGGGY